ncbi:MAG: DUF3617 family protein [Pseudomonadota bacterium]
MDLKPIAAVLAAAFVIGSGAANAEVNTLTIERGYWKDTVTQSMSGVLRGATLAGTPETTDSFACYQDADDLNITPTDLVPAEQCSATIISSTSTTLSISFVCNEDEMISKGTTMASVTNGGTGYNIDMTFEMSAPNALVTTKASFSGVRQAAICVPEAAGDAG